MTDRNRIKLEPDAEASKNHEAQAMTVVLLEQEDGTTTSAEVPYPPGTPMIHVEGVPYSHVGEDGDNWIYRKL